jgi:hypothetical protein
MGAVQIQYCDVCGAELVNVLFRGILRDVPSNANVAEADLCGTCYSKLLEFLKTRKEEQTALWTPAAPEPVPLEGEDLGV